jgi:putative ABC transport system permease protein
LALVLSVGAGLLARSFARLAAVNPGFDVERVVAMSLSPAGRYPNVRATADYFERVVSEVRAAPGVESASTIQFLAMEGLSRSCFSPPTDGPLPPVSAQPSAQFAVIGPDYFRTMGIPIERGREFDNHDRLGAPTVILVNHAFAKKFYPGEDPLGKKLVVCWTDTLKNPAEIVGIAGDARHADLADAPEPTIFVANLQTPAFGNLIVRAKGDPAQIARAAVAAIHQVNPDQAVAKIRTLKEVVDDSVARPRFQSALMLVFAGVALLLASIGVYGVASYSVAQRTNEIGIRVAVGASRGDIARLILREGAVMCGIGMTVGLAAAFALTRFLASLLYQISPADPATLALVCGVLAASVAIAIALPVRRAMRVDPMTALRYE